MQNSDNKKVVLWFTDSLFSALSAACVDECTSREKKEMQNAKYIDC